MSHFVNLVLLSPSAYTKLGPAIQTIAPLSAKAVICVLLAVPALMSTVIVGCAIWVDVAAITELVTSLPLFGTFFIAYSLKISYFSTVIAGNPLGGAINFACCMSPATILTAAAC